MTAHDVALLVGPEGLRIDVWDRYTLDVSMLSVGAAWTLSFWYSERARASWNLLIDPERGVRCGQTVTATIDGEAVLTGIVETRDVGDDGARATPTFTISGRDKLGPATSWDADPALALKNLPLEEALSRLYAGVGIVAEVSESVDSERPVGALRRPRRGGRARRVSRRQQIQISHPRVGEKVQAVVERIVRGLGYRVWTTPAERADRTVVIVDRPKSSGAPTFNLRRVLQGGRVTEDSNILQGRERVSIREAPSTVTTYASAPRGDSPSAAFARTVSNAALSARVNRARIDPLTAPRPRFVQSDQARSVEGAQAEGARLIAEANEELRRYEATVEGHRQGGRLWMPNTLCAVRDELVGLDETMLVVSASYSGSRQDGPKTRLTSLPLGALSETPVPA